MILEMVETEGIALTSLAIVAGLECHLHVIDRNAARGWLADDAIVKVNT